VAPVLALQQKRQTREAEETEQRRVLEEKEDAKRIVQERRRVRPEMLPPSPSIAINVSFNYTAGSRTRACRGSQSGTKIGGRATGRVRYFETVFQVSL
jgi:hypothetical protein